MRCSTSWPEIWNTLEALAWLYTRSTVPCGSALTTTPRRNPYAPSAEKLIAATLPPVAVGFHCNCCCVWAAARVATTSRAVPTWRGPIPPPSEAVLEASKAPRLTREGVGAVTSALRDLMFETPWSTLAGCTQPSTISTEAAFCALASVPLPPHPANKASAAPQATPIRHIIPFFISFPRSGQNRHRTRKQLPQQTRKCTTWPTPSVPV